MSEKTNKEKNPYNQDFVIKEIKFYKKNTQSRNNLSERNRRPVLRPNPS